MSIKFLEVADFHLGPATIEQNKKNAEAVRIAAEKNSVDFIACPGDFFDSHLYATDKGGYNEARRILESWAEIAPVCVVEGTPSHDGPGCYDGLPVTVLQPGRAYGVWQEYGKEGAYSHICEITKESISYLLDPQCILFGFPEANKKNVVARFGLSSDEAGAKAEQLLEAYVRDFVAPMRAKYANVPAVGLFHGNITEAESRENETDEILKNSEIMARYSWFRDAGIDRLSCGHYHKPSSLYVGSWGMSWNETGFVPKFNLTEIQENGQKITHIPYGTPKRLKITDPIQATDPDVAYWLETKDPTATLPEKVHPWSRVTYKEDSSVTRRVTEEEAQKARNLWDLALLMAPGTNKNLRPMFDEIDQQIPQDHGEPADIRVANVEVAGCVFFKGDTVRFSIDDLADGLINVHGSNGAGKSSLLSFCHPYPGIIGKDTDSGRDSAIHCFFNKRESYIKKTVYKNDDRYCMQVNIKGAHTKNPKVEAYISKNGTPALDRCTFDELQAYCEAEFGPMDDYKVTSFYEQPQQAVNQQSGLMSTKKIDARNIVLKIAGIDRSRELRYALDKKAEYAGQVVPLEAKIQAITESLEDEEELNGKIMAAREKLAEAEAELSAKKSSLEVARQAVETAKSAADSEDAKKAEKAELDKKAEEIRNNIFTIESEIVDLHFLSKSLADKRARLSSNKETARIYTEWQTEKNRITAENTEANRIYLEVVQAEREAYNTRYEEIRQENNRLRDDWITEKQKAVRENEKKAAAGETICNFRDVINQISSPCEKCGHIASDVQAKIDNYNSEITRLLPVADQPLRNIPAEPEYTRCAPFSATTQPPVLQKTPEEPAQPIDDFSLSLLEDEIRKAESAEAVINEKNNLLDMLTAQADDLKKRSDSILINHDAAANRDVAIVKKDHAEELFQQASKTRDNAASDIVVLEHRRDSLVAQLQRVAEHQKNLSGIKKTANRWAAVADMLQPNKIPALELDMVLDSIDAEATRNIQAYRDGIYSYKTQTQEMGKKALVDRFDIMIHDATTGEYKSLFKFSPGEKAFLSDSYIKALIRKRKEKAGIEYSPIISDEADGPVEPACVGQYYAVQNAYFTKPGQKVLIVSHAPDAHNYIQNQIEVDSLKGVN